MTSELETQLVSVERVKEYSETDTEVTNDNNSNKDLKLLNSELEGLLRDSCRFLKNLTQNIFKLV